MVRRPISVLIADDHLINREGLKKILEIEEDIKIVGEALTAQESVQKARDLRPDIVLMDLKWWTDEGAGTRAILEIKRIVPETKIIAITAYDDLAPGARKVGAAGVLPRGFSRSELIEMIRAVHSLESFDAAPSAGMELTEREMEILVLLARGLSDLEIAENLIIAPNTARNHVASIISKLGASNRANAVAIAFDKGLLRRTKS